MSASRLLGGETEHKVPRQTSVGESGQKRNDSCATGVTLQTHHDLRRARQELIGAVEVMIEGLGVPDQFSLTQIVYSKVGSDAAAFPNMPHRFGPLSPACRTLDGLP